MAVLIAGKSKPARIAMMAITVRSSIMVNPRLDNEFFLIVFLLVIRLPVRDVIGRGSDAVRPFAPKIISSPIVNARTDVLILITERIDNFCHVSLSRGESGKILFTGSHAIECVEQDRRATRKRGA